MGNQLLKKARLWVAVVVCSCGTAPVTACDYQVKEPTVVDDCAETCATWVRLGCEEGEDSPEFGVTCVDVCERTHEFEPVNHQCIQGSTSCEAARECEE